MPKSKRDKKISLTRVEKKGGLETKQGREHLLCSQLYIKYNNLIGRKYDSPITFHLSP